jgi:hypothetical protein
MTGRTNGFPSTCLGLPSQRACFLLRASAHQDCCPWQCKCASPGNLFRHSLATRLVLYLVPLRRLSPLPSTGITVCRSLFRPRSAWRSGGESHMRSDRVGLVLGFFLVFTVPLFAQDTPIGTPGTQVATEETPAAATNTDALRKAAQNPIASLVNNVWSSAGTIPPPRDWQLRQLHPEGHALKIGARFSPILPRQEIDR